MKEAYAFELANLMGGACEIKPSVECTALQNQASQFGSTWTKEQWNEWEEAWESLCVK